MVWTGVYKSEKEGKQLWIGREQNPFIWHINFLQCQDQVCLPKRAKWVDCLYAYWVMGLQVFCSNCIYTLSKMNICPACVGSQPYHLWRQLVA